MKQQIYHGPRCIRVLAGSQEQITLPVYRQHWLEMLKATPLLPLLHLRRYLKNSLLVSNSLLLSNSLPSFLCPSQLVSGMPHRSFIKIPHLSSTSHSDLSFVVSLEGIHLPRRSLLVLPWWGELLLLFLHWLHRSNLDSRPQRCFCSGAQGGHEGKGRVESISCTHAAVLGVHRQMACQNHPLTRSSNEPCWGSRWLLQLLWTANSVKKRNACRVQAYSYTHPFLGGLSLSCIHGSSLQAGLGLGPVFDNINP